MEVFPRDCVYIDYSAFLSLALHSVRSQMWEASFEPTSISPGYQTLPGSVFDCSISRLVIALDSLKDSVSIT
jgi:hypothetical protein